jgi:hypothetical protein
VRATTPESGTNRARGAGAETFFTKPLDFGVLHGETEARVERAGRRSRPLVRHAKMEGDQR